MHEWRREGKGWRIDMKSHPLFWCDAQLKAIYSSFFSLWARYDGMISGDYWWLWRGWLFVGGTNFHVTFCTECTFHIDGYGTCYAKLWKRLGNSQKEGWKAGREFSNVSLQRELHEENNEKRTTMTKMWKKMEVGNVRALQLWEAMAALILIPRLQCSARGSLYLSQGSI